MKKLMMLMIALVLSINFVSAAEPNVEISSFSSTPSSVEPGKELSLSIEVENIGSEDADNVFVTLDLNMVPFAPVSGSSSKNLEELRDGDSERVSFRLIAQNTAEPGIYKVPVLVRYEHTVQELVNGNLEDVVETRYSEGLIGLKISGEPKLDITVDDSFLIVNQAGEIDIQFTNRGKGDVKFLTVSLRDVFGYDIIGNKQVYVGDVDSDDFETVTFDVISFSDITNLVVDIEYEDFEGNAFEESHELNVDTYTVEEAQNIGLIPKSNAWMFGVGLVVVVGFFVIRRIRKKRKNNAL